MFNNYIIPTLYYNVILFSGVAQSTIYRTIKEYKEKGQITPPRQSSGRHSSIADYDETVKNSIRQLIHRFFFIKMNFLHLIK